MAEQAQTGENTFIVTQIINPSYFHLFNPYLRDDKARETLEENLVKEIRNFGYTGLDKKLKKGDIVAFYWQKGKRYIRCEIDDVKVFNFSKYYFLFALDYGVSLFTTKIEEVHPISGIMKFAKSAIMNKISLSILPIITEFDYIKNQEETLFHNSWCQLALKLFQQSLNHASVIKFEMSDDLPGYKGFLFGDLIIDTFYGIKFSLCETLINAKVAKKASSIKEFQKHFDRLNERGIERWNDNSKTGGILNFLEEGQFPLYYEEEIQLKRCITNCEAVQSRKVSVQKVIDWQLKYEDYEFVLPTEDEGFDETIINFKRKNESVASTSQSKFGIAKKLKFDECEESIISGVSNSASQIFPHTAQYNSKQESLKKIAEN